MTKFSFLFGLALLPVLNADSLYDSTPGTPLPATVAGQSYDAANMSQFGELVQLTSEAIINTATVVVDTWAPQAPFPTFTDPSGYTLSITLNLFNIDNTSGTAEPGSLIASVTTDQLIPWRAPSDPSCTGGPNPYGEWITPSSVCKPGEAFSLTFSLPSVLTGSSFIWGLAFNTSDSGTPPFASAGPYDALNIGILIGSPSVGSQPLPDTAYFNSTAGNQYADGGAGGTGTFRQDTGWTGDVAMINFIGDPVPEPSSAALALFGIAGIACRRMRRSR